MAGDLLLRGGIVVTMTGTGDDLGVVTGDVLVEDGAITAVGAGPADASTVVDCTGMVVLPGFVQAHVHLNQTLFRGLDDDAEIAAWLRRTVWPLESAHDHASVHAAASLGIAELLRSGTTSVLSIEAVSHTAAVFEAAAALGIRAVTGPSTMDLAEPSTGVGNGCSTEAARAELLALVDRWHGAYGGRLRVAASPRGTRAATPDTWRWAVALAHEHDLRLHTHVSENAALADRLAQEPGGRDLYFLHDVGALGPRLTMAHCVWLDGGERDLLRRSGASVCHCPSSNLKLASGIAPIPEYLDDGVNVALGADSATCANTLDAFTELRLAALLHKPAYGPTAMPAATVLRLATIGGARALGLGDHVGTIEVGKRADVVVASLARSARSALLPEQSLASLLAYSMNASDVHTVVVDGRIVVADGVLTTGDEAAIVATASRERAALLARARVSGWTGADPHPRSLLTASVGGSS